MSSEKVLSCGVSFTKRDNIDNKTQSFFVKKIAITPEMAQRINDKIKAFNGLNALMDVVYEKLDLLDFLPKTAKTDKSISVNEVVKTRIQALLNSGKTAEQIRKSMVESKKYSEAEVLTYLPITPYDNAKTNNDIGF